VTKWLTALTDWLACTSAVAGAAWFYRSVSQSPAPPPSPPITSRVSVTVHLGETWMTSSHYSRTQRGHWATVLSTVSVQSRVLHGDITVFPAGFPPMWGWIAVKTLLGWVYSTLEYRGNGNSFAGIAEGAIYECLSVRTIFNLTTGQLRRKRNQLHFSDCRARVRYAQYFADLRTNQYNGYCTVGPTVFRMIKLTVRLTCGDRVGMRMNCS